MFKALLLRLISGAAIVGGLFLLGIHRGRIHGDVAKPHFCISQGAEDKLTITEDGEELTLRAFGDRIGTLAAKGTSTKLDGCSTTPAHRMLELMSYCRRRGMCVADLTLLNCAPVAEDDFDLLAPVYLTISLQNGAPVLSYEEREITLPQFKEKLRKLVAKEEDQPVVFIAEDELNEYQWEDIIGSCMEEVRGFDNYGIEAPDRSYPYRRVHSSRTAE